jgi:hypothetical protein
MKNGKSQMANRKWQIFHLRFCIILHLSFTIASPSPTDHRPPATDRHTTSAKVFSIRRK